MINRNLKKFDDYAGMPIKKRHFSDPQTSHEPYEQYNENAAVSTVNIAADDFQNSLYSLEDFIHQPSTSSTNPHFVNKKKRASTNLDSSSQVKNLF